TSASAMRTVAAARAKSGTLIAESPLLAERTPHAGDAGKTDAFPVLAVVARAGRRARRCAGAAASRKFPETDRAILAPRTQYASMRIGEAHRTGSSALSREKMLREETLSTGARRPFGRRRGLPQGWCGSPPDPVAVEFCGRRRRALCCRP